MSIYEVIVGNLGTVHSGKSELSARKVFAEYVKKSLTGQGRASGEEVTILKDGEPIKTHYVPDVLKNPRDITTDIVKAFLAGKSKKIDNTTTDGEVIYLHGHPIVKKLNGGIYINAALHATGSISTTTKERLNAFAKVTVSKGQLLCNGEPWDGGWKKVDSVQKNPAKRQSVSKNPREDDELVDAYGESIKGKRKKNLGVPSFKNPTTTQLKSGIVAICLLDGVQAATIKFKYLKDKVFTVQSDHYEFFAHSLEEAKKIYLQNWHKLIGAGFYGATDEQLAARLKKNPLSKAGVNKIIKMIEGTAKKAVPRVKSHLVSLHSKLKKNPPNEAGGMSAFENDVVRNPKKDKVADLSEFIFEGYAAGPSFWSKLIKAGVPKDIEAKIAQLGNRCSSIEEGAWELTSWLKKGGMTNAKATEILGSSVKKNPRRKSMDDFITCPHCEGNGSYDRMFDRNGGCGAPECAGGYRCVHREECPDCGGRGYFDKYPLDEQRAHATEILGSSVKNNPRRKSMADFIKENKAELDAAIGKVIPGVRLNNKDREEWIRNDEGLYHWARSCGVKV